MTDSTPDLPHILVVDDSGSARRSLERALSPHVRVTLAQSVPEALSLLTPDVKLVLSDILMPGESGFDLVASLKRSHPQLPVVLFSGVVDLEMRAQAQALGVDTVLRKPLTAEQLLKVLRDWVEIVPIRPAPTPVNPAVTPPRRTPPQAAVAPPPAPAPEKQAEAKPELDQVSLVCRKPGVLSAFQFSDLGEVERQWNLPFPPGAGSRAITLLRELEDWAETLGASWEEGRFMQLPLSNRVLLVGKVNGRGLGLVVRDTSVAAEVMREFQALAGTAGK